MEFRYCPPFPSWKEAPRLREAFRHAVSLYTQWTDPRAPRSAEISRKTNHCWWYCDALGLEVVEQEDLPILKALELWERRHADPLGGLAFDMYPGRLPCVLLTPKSPYPSTQLPSNAYLEASLEELWSEAVAPRFIRVGAGALAGELLGPFYGWDETEQFGSALERLGAVPKQQGVLDPFARVPLSEWTELDLDEASPPWHALVELMGEQAALDQG